MKTPIPPFHPPALFVPLLVAIVGCAGEGPTPYLAGAQGDYLGLAAPGEEMEIFAPGLLTFGTHEHHLAMTPEGDEIFFVIADRYRRHHTIIQVEREGDRWRRPKVAGFSGNFNDFAPTPSPDGSVLLFCSNRPLPGEGGEPGDVNLWRVPRREDGWGKPEPLPGEVNDESNEYNPTLTLDGVLYFQDHDERGVDIYRADLQDGRYGAPRKVEGINTPYSEIGPLVFPDGNTLVFSSDRPGAQGGEGDMDFWVAYMDASGNWSEPRNMGPAINTASADAIITLSPDGAFFFFTNFLAPGPERLRGQPYDELVEILDGPENGDGTVYWISAGVVEDLRNGE